MNEGQKSAEFKTTIGVKQGGPLSPRLFSIYIEKLLIDITNERLGIQLNNRHIAVIGYADDILLISHSKKNINRMLSICEKFGEDWEIAWNPKKTQAMVVNGQFDKNNTHIKIKFCENVIEEVDKLKYLEVIIDTKLSTTGHIEERIQKARRSTYALTALGICSQYLNKRIKTILYKTFCRSILLYGCEVIDLKAKDISALQTAEGNIVKRILGLHKTSRTTSLLYALNIEPIHGRYSISQIDMIKRIINNPVTRDICIYQIIKQKDEPEYDTVRALIKQSYDYLKKEYENTSNTDPSALL